MGEDDPRGLTERQQKWLASVRASLEAETGKTLEQWAEIARSCPEARPRARQQWLKANYGLGQNRAALVLEAAFPAQDSWSEPDALRATLWTDAAARKLFEPLEMAATAEPEADSRLEAPRNEPWSERLHARRRLTTADEVDAALVALLKRAWERS